MEKLLQLLKIAELTRHMPQYGYVISGIPQDELSNLAEHHYLVTFIAWQLALGAKQAGADLEIRLVLELCMIHDFGELFGGDIAQPYAQVHPAAKIAARTLEKHNHTFLLPFFGGNEHYVRELFSQAMEPERDEAFIFKLADNVECILYQSTGRFQGLG